MHDAIEGSEPITGVRQEVHRLVAEGAELSLAVQFAVIRPGPYSSRSVATFHTAVMAPRMVAGPLVIAVNDMSVPNRWEFRATGLWAEQTCEQPWVHWSYGLEAFALEIDSPDELLHRGFGHRVPLGWELDFVASDGKRGEVGGLGHTVQPGRLEGLLMVGRDRLELTIPSARRERWLDVEPPDRTVVAGPPPLGADWVALPTPAGVWRLVFASAGRPSVD